MKRILIFCLLTMTVFLIGCASQNPSSVELARNYWQCRVLQTLSGKVCALSESLLDEVDSVLANISTGQNLGQLIMDTQSQLVTLEQEHAKKNINDDERAKLAQKIIETQRKVLVLHCAFLVITARQH